LHVRTHRQLGIAKLPLAVCLALSGLAVAGCSAVPAGATDDPSSASPVSTGSVSAAPVSTGSASATPLSAGSIGATPVSTGPEEPSFAPFPVPSTWSGGSGTDYTAIFSTVSKATPREFSFTATSSMVFWLACIGTGTAQIVSPALNLNWGVPCDPGTGVDPTGITFIPPRAAVGTLVEVEVTSLPGSPFEFRIDEPQSQA
jgi:hypothetical protein